MKTRVALLAVALVGCGHVEVHEVVLRAPSGRSAQPPEIFLEGSAPPRPFYEIALLQAIGFAADATPEDVADALRARAQELGCDALVRVRIDEGGDARERDRRVRPLVASGRARRRAVLFGAGRRAMT